MAIDPAASSTPDPAWMDFVAGHVDVVKTAPEPVSPALSVIHPSHVFPARLPPAVGVPARGRVPVWARSREALVAYAAVTPPTVVSVLAEASAWQYGQVTAGVWAGVVTALFGAGGTVFLAKDWSKPVGYGLLGVAGIALQGTVAAGGGFLPSLIAWAVAAAGCGATWVLRRDYATEHYADVHLTDAKADLMRLKGENENLKLHAQIQAAANANVLEQGPDLRGHTPEETTMRHVMWDVHGVELDGCTVENTPTGWTALVTLPVKLPRSKFRADWPKVESGLGVDGSFELADGALSNQVVVRFVAGDPLAVVVPYTRQHATAWDAPVHLGIDRYLASVDVEMAYSHTLVAGSSKFGKSTLVRSIIIQLADRDDVVLVGADLKPGSPELTPMRPIMQAVAGTAEQAHALLDWLRAELEERGEILSAAGDQEWVPAKHGRPALFVVIDELAELQRQADDGPWKDEPASKKLESLLALMRFAGMHLIAATQQPSRKVFGGTTDARGNYAIRISTRMNDQDHYRFVFGASGDWHKTPLDMPGKFTISDPDHQQPAPYKGMYLKGDEFRAEVARIAAKHDRAPLPGRLILPVSGKSNQEKVRAALGEYGPMTRTELETATGLSDQKVRDAARMCKDVERVEDANVWRLTAE